MRLQFQLTYSCKEEKFVHELVLEALKNAKELYPYTTDYSRKNPTRVWRFSHSRLDNNLEIYQESPWVIHGFEAGQKQPGIDFYVSVAFQIVNYQPIWWKIEAWLEPRAFEFSPNVTWRREIRVQQITNSFETPDTPSEDLVQLLAGELTLAFQEASKEAITANQLISRLLREQSRNTIRRSQS